MKAIASFLLLLISSTAFAQRPNITGYEIPFIQYSKMNNAETVSVKGLSTTGKKETKSLSIERIDLGMFRERYDNKFSEFSLFYAESDEGEVSALPGIGDAELSKQIGISYSSGLHLSNTVDWALTIDTSTATLKVDGVKENKLGMGISTRLVYVPIQYFEIGFKLSHSSHYSGAGAIARVVF